MSSRSNRTSDRDRRSRGQSLVEFALILPVFILLFGAALDLGRLFYAQITITNAAREGALQAGEDPDSYTGGACDPETNLVVCRVVMESRDSFVSITPADVSMSCNPSCERLLGNLAVVSVRGQFTFLTPIVAPFFGGSQTVPLNATASAQIQTYPVVPLPSASPSPSPTAVPTPTPTPTPSPTPSPAPTASGSASPAPSGSAAPAPSASASPSPSPFPYDCVQPDGSPGVLPPNVVGLSPAEGEVLMRAKEFLPVGATVSKGKPGQIQAQSPDHTVCAAQGSEIQYLYRP